MRLRILLVDDDEEFRNFARDCLRGLDCDIEEVANGQAALEKLYREPFDVLITDLRMPLMQGDELARRAQNGFPELKTVILSATPEDARGAGRVYDKFGIHETLPRIIAGLRAGTA